MSCDASDGACFATAVSCIDGRVHAPVIEWARRRFGVEYVDLVTQPGPDLALCCASDATVEAVRQNLAASTDAHRPVALVVAGHADCAANPGGADAHRRQLRKAVSRARRWIPDLPIVAVWVDAESEVHEIEPEAAPA